MQTIVEEEGVYIGSWHLIKFDGATSRTPRGQPDQLSLGWTLTDPSRSQQTAEIFLFQKVSVFRGTSGPTHTSNG